jgi:lambda repressor-like predicted transcriptional regulator
MTLVNTIQNHLATSGLSMRALSLQAGLNPKAVADILNHPGRVIASTAWRLNH